MDQVQLEVLRAEAIAADRSFSKGRLRDEFRMKPKPDATPVAHYKNGYGGTFGVYRIADCLPMRDRKAAAPSPKQVRAAAILALKGRMQSKVAKASHVAVQWLATAPLVLDAETTGLGTEAQIIELAIADVPRAAAQFFTLVKGEAHALLVFGCGGLGPDEVEAHLRASVDLFLRAYAAQGPNGSR